MNTDIISYYRDRAKEYEAIYHKPERQHDLKLASNIFQEIFTNKTVFEIACGTGYWTQIIARTALSILATDINESVIEIAKTKDYSPAKVSFQTADIFNSVSHQTYQSLFGGFIWSHIPLQELNRFIDAVNSQVESSGTIVFMDNNYVQGSSTPISETDKWNNTYQQRKLKDGTTHKVIKNFPNEMSIKEVLKEKAEDIRFVQLQYFWLVQYKKI